MELCLTLHKILVDKYEIDIERKTKVIGWNYAIVTLQHSAQLQSA